MSIKQQSQRIGFWFFGFLFTTSMILWGCNEDAVLEGSPDPDPLPLGGNPSGNGGNDSMGGVEMADVGGSPSEPQINPDLSPEVDCTPGNYNAYIRFVALVSDNQTSTSMTLLDQCGHVLPCAKDLFSSAVVGRAQLTTPLSGDVVLPTQTPHHENILFIDRSGGGVVTTYHLQSGEVHQTITYAEAEPGAGPPEQTPRVNPHDAMMYEGGILSTRYDPWRREGTAHINQGNDLIFANEGYNPRQVDPEINTFERIEMDPFNERVQSPFIEGRFYTVYARPSKLLALHEGTAVVTGLAYLSGNFQIPTFGGLGILNRADDNGQWTTSKHDLPEDFVNCGTVAPVADDDSRVIAQCGGETFSSEAQRRESAGLVQVHIDEDLQASNEYVWRAADHAQDVNGQRVLAPFIDGVVSLGESLVLVPGAGDSDQGADQPGGSANDQVLFINLETGHTEVVYEATPLEGTRFAYYVIRSLMYDPMTQLLLIADATVGLRRFRVHIDGPESLRLEPLGSTQNDVLSCANRGVNAGSILPVRQVSILEPVTIIGPQCNADDPCPP